MLPALFTSAGLILAGKCALKLLAAILVTDFISGAAHWFEDAYAREQWPVTGKWITRLNVLHHHHPRAFVRNSWWQSSWDLTLAVAIVVLLAWAMGCLTWPVWVFALIGANANQIHKWTHRTPRKNGKIITALQRLHIVQSVRHHARHHTDPKDSHYCVITDFLNPILDGVRFWEGLEFVLLHLFGMPPLDRFIREASDSLALDDSPGSMIACQILCILIDCTKKFPHFATPLPLPWYCGGGLGWGLNQFDLTNQINYISSDIMLDFATAAILEHYPTVFFACHRRHVRDGNTKRLLSSAQAAVLDHLDPLEPVHLHELAAHLGVTPSTMCLMVDRLQRGGFVTRSRDTRDARRTNLLLTPAGLRIKQQQKILDPDLVRELLRRLTAGERKNAVAGLEHLAKAAAEIMASRQISKTQLKAAS